MQGLTTAQAAFVVGEPLGAFKKMIERAPLKTTLVRHGGRWVRQFSWGDLVFLRAYLDGAKQLFTPKAQSELYEAILANIADGRALDLVAFGELQYILARQVVSLELKLKELDELSAQIDASGKEPVIRGTKVLVYRIAALLDANMTLKEILQDYPSLSKNQLLAAKAFAETHPKAGRPYPKLTVKAAMRAADLSALDDVD